jgi:hypothetical protein
VRKRGPEWVGKNERGLTLLLIKVDANLSVSGAASKPSPHPHHLGSIFQRLFVFVFWIEKITLAFSAWFNRQSHSCAPRPTSIKNHYILTVIMLSCLKKYIYSQQHERCSIKTIIWIFLSEKINAQTTWTIMSSSFFLFLSLLVLILNHNLNVHKFLDTLPLQDGF